MTNKILAAELQAQLIAELKDKCGGRCNAKYNPCWALELADKLSALPDAPDVSVEPVAWTTNDELEFLRSNERASATLFNFKEPDQKFVPLYTAPTQSAQSAQQIPAGWKLVPIEPTVEMLDAADASDREYSLRNFGAGTHICQGGEDHWSAMLSAAPQPPQGEVK